MIKIELSIQDANTLLSLLDLAVKAGGIQAAAVALPLVKQLQDAAKDLLPETEVAAE